MKKALFIIAEMILLAAIICLMIHDYTALAEDYESFIICDPCSYVNIRRTPKKGGEVCGQLYCGDRIMTDGVERNGFLHCVDLSTEYGEGWVHLGYVVPDQPQTVDGYGVITSTGRVAARKWVSGKRKSWIRPGTRVRVLAVSDEWTLTARGFIRSEFLTISDGE